MIQILHDLDFKLNQFRHLLMHDLLNFKHLGGIVSRAKFTQEDLTKSTCTNDFNQVKLLQRETVVSELLIPSDLFHLKNFVWSIL
jgi:hypothetical protein